MKILLSGYSGAMGKVITELCEEIEGYEIIAGYARNKIKGLSYPVYNDISLIKEDIDVIIDFSNVGALTNILSYGLEKNIPMVIASTGLGEVEYAQIKKASESIPIIQSGNLSLGINLLIDIIKNLIPSLIDFDIEVIEKHHKFKTDAPSGTAMMLAEVVRENRKDVNQFVYGREGNDSKRKDGEVGIHAIRGGTMLGEHSIIFAGLDEVLEIKHTAGSKRIFAIGAIKAAGYIVKQTNGLYSMKDVIL